MIAIQVSLYPIGEKDIKKSLDDFWNILKEENINHKVTPLSTITWGDDDEEKLYRVIYKAYKKARENGPAVMVTTLTTGDKEQIGELLDYL